MSESNEKQPSDSTKTDNGAGVDCRPMSCSLVDIPDEVFEASETLHSYFTREGRSGWEFNHVASRLLVSKLRKQVADGKRNGHRVAVQRDKLQDALREMVAAKGRYNTQRAMEHLISLLPENSIY